MNASKESAKAPDAPAPTCPFAGLPGFPAPLSAKQKLIVEISGILHDLDLCFLPLPDDPLRIPAEGQLAELHASVGRLAESYRKRKKPQTSGESFKVVDRKIHSLRLLKRIRGISERAAKYLPERPLEIFWQLALRKPATRRDVDEFFHVVKQFRAEAPTVTDKQWQNHRERFCKMLREVLVFVTDEQWKKFAGLLWELKAFAKAPSIPKAMQAFLEIVQDDNAWRDQYGNAASDLFIYVAMLDEPDLLERLNRFVIPGVTSDDIASHQEFLDRIVRNSSQKDIEARKRKQDRERKARQRKRAR